MWQYNKEKDPTATNSWICLWAKFDFLGETCTFSVIQAVKKTQNKFFICNKFIQNLQKIITWEN